MKANVGSYDAGARFILGCGVLFMTVNGAGWWGALGLIPLITCTLGYCPLNQLLGIDTMAWEQRMENRLRRRHPDWYD
jgi:hypothetical protein